MAYQTASGEDRIAEAIDRLAQALQGLGAAAQPQTTAAAEPAGGFDLSALLTTGKERFIDFLPTLVAALAILVLGWIAAKIVTGLLRKALGSSKLDPTLVNFLSSVIHLGLLVFVLVSAITKLGVNTTSFVAILGAAGFAVGFAMQGSLSNFAAAVMLMIFRPLRVGDLVEAGGVLGIVEDVGVFATTINTLENRRAIIANSAVTGSNIINYSANGRLRVDMTFGISYADDMDRAMEVMNRVLAEDSRVLKEPAPTIGCKAHGDSSVVFVCRPHVHPDDYWGVWFDTHKRVKEEFDKAGVSIPFPQRDVHMIPAAG